MSDIPMSNERAIELLILANRCIHEIRRGAVDGTVYSPEVYRRIRSLKFMANKVAADQRRLARLAGQPLIDVDERANRVAEFFAEMPPDFDAWDIREGTQAPEGERPLIATRRAGDMSIRIVQSNRGRLRNRMTRVERDLGNLFDYLENKTEEGQS